MYKRTASKPLGIMDRRVPKNDKYSHVQGRLDTGLTVDKVKQVTAREYSKRRDEIFFRLSRGQLYELFNEYEATDHEWITESEGGVDGAPKIVTYSESAEPQYSKPYLILDVREADAYNRCHILQARSFPYAMLRRDQNHADFFRFRNKPEMLIIVYCDDERVSRDVAKVMVDRGCDNMFLLSGGLNEFAAEFPGYVEGEPPVAPRTTSKRTPVARGTGLGRIHEDSSTISNPATPRGKLAGGGGAGGSGTGSYSRTSLHDYDNSRSPAGSTRIQRPGLAAGAGTGRRDDRSESGFSTRSNVSVAESIISRAVSRKGKF